MSQNTNGNMAKAQEVEIAQRFDGGLHWFEAFVILSDIIFETIKSTRIMIYCVKIVLKKPCNFTFEIKKIPEIPVDCTLLILCALATSHS